MGKVPDGVFELYEEFVDSFISDDFGVNCKLYYPPKKEVCPDCSGVNVYSSGFSAPTNFGNCGLCGGTRYREIEQSEVIKLRVYYRPKDFIKIANIEVPQGAIQVIGFYDNLPAFLRANEVEPNTDKAGLGSTRYKKLNKVYPHGFKQRRYFVSFMERA